jgi:hypothetical protein
MLPLTTSITQRHNMGHLIMRARLSAAFLAASLLTFSLSTFAQAGGLFSDLAGSVGNATAVQQSRAQKQATFQNLFGKPQPKQQTWGLPKDNAKLNCLSINYDLYAERRSQNEGRTDSYKKARDHYNEQNFKDGQRRCMQ